MRNVTESEEKLKNALAVEKFARQNELDVLTAEKNSKANEAILNKFMYQKWVCHVVR